MDASSGASGDMLLGALVGAGVPVETIAAAVAAVAPEHVALRPEPVTRHGFAATRCHVEVADSSTHRSWADVAELLAAADLAEPVRARAHACFERLANAEAAVHGTTPEQVHFHEVGALDAIADVVGVCAGVAHLGLEHLVVSPVAVGSGTVRGAHGAMPVPPPAVAELLLGAPSYSGPGRSELCTPTGAALLTTLATEFGPQPPMAVEHVGVGAGARDPDTHPNVLRLFVGMAAAAASTAVVVETNVDDLDPRLWPNVLAALLDAGASDAWLTPILMKKGRPAHTLSVLVTTERLDPVRAEIFRQTSTIGVREIPVGKTALERRMATVEVSGCSIRVKIAEHGGSVVNVQPEYDDVAAAATATGRPAKDVLADAVAECAALRQT
ncbi:MAG TPA: nickel pincer cofactor biosynthesis protein LarC [Nocardioidaceae bacterium]|nr:nickel pincer cofactor biosynthesis protein LarC [Nocardioidaceae bacterium]